MWTCWGEHWSSQPGIQPCGDRFGECPQRGGLSRTWLSQDICLDSLSQFVHHQTQSFFSSSFLTIVPEENIVLRVNQLLSVYFRALLTLTNTSADSNTSLVSSSSWAVSILSSKLSRPSPNLPRSRSLLFSIHRLSQGGSDQPGVANT